MPRRSVLPGWVLSALLVVGCSSEPVGIGPDGQTDPDAAVPLPDGAPPPQDARVETDGGVYCAEPLQAGAVVGTAVEPTEPTPQTLEYRMEGEATYHGAVTEPLASNPAFDHELQLQHADGTVSIIQYYLPPDLTVPIAIGGGYTVLYRQVIGFEGNATGLVIARNTSGLPPLVLVLDLGEYGRAFEPEDSAMSPLKVYEAGGLGCWAEDPQGCGGVLGQQLRFDSSTGAATVEVTVPHATRATLPVFGFDHHVVVLSALTRTEPCPDLPTSLIAYLSVLAE